MKLYLSLFLCICKLGALDRTSSAPYLSGDTFRSFANHVFDETASSFLPQSVLRGDVIFVKTDMLEDYFLKIHAQIQNPYVLITHNSDLPIPGNFAQYLDDPNLIVWFGQNVENCNHPKIIPIPIGIANKQWPHGSTEVLERCRKNATPERKYLIYMNFEISTHPERSSVYELFNCFLGCRISLVKCFEEYLADLKQTKFVLSPRGNGLDCHRTWEALYMGAVPIVKTSTLDPLFTNLPVLIVNDWEEVTEDFLENAWEVKLTSSYNLSRLYAPYWRNLIDEYRFIEPKTFHKNQDVFQK